MSTFEVVEEKDFPSPGGGPHYRDSIHNDIYEALAYLRKNPQASVRIAGGEGKRHTVFVYAQRFKMLIETRVKDGFVFIRLQGGRLNGNGSSS